MTVLTVLTESVVAVSPKAPRVGPEPGYPGAIQSFNSSDINVAEVYAPRSVTSRGVLLREVPRGASAQGHSPLRAQGSLSLHGSAATGCWSPVQGGKRREGVPRVVGREGYTQDSREAGIP